MSKTNNIEEKTQRIRVKYDFYRDRSECLEKVPDM